MGKNVLHPPSSFVQIEKGIYCAGTIFPNNFPFLRRKGLRLVVTLSPEQTIASLEQFALEEAIEHRALGYEIQEKYKGSSDHLLKESLQVLLNPEHHPILFHTTSYDQIAYSITIYLEF